MKSNNFLIFLVLIPFLVNVRAFSQDITGNGRPAAAIIDSLKNSGYIFNENRKEPDIKLTRDQAIKFLQQQTRSMNWSDAGDPLRKALSQLVYEASHVRFDSVKYYLQEYSYDSLIIPWEKFYIWEPLRLKIPVASVPEFPMKVDTTGSPDTTFVQMQRVDPFSPVAREGLKDTTIMVVIDTLSRLAAGREGSVLRYFDYPYQGDSLRIAVISLIDFLEKRDSVMINFTGASRTKIPVWLGSRKNESMRYWLRNEFSDSVTVWIGCEDKNTISLYLEQGINFRKPARQENYSEAKINVQAIDKSKLLKQQFTLKKDYWKYRTESSLIFSQAALSNWVKGGENSVSTALDITAYADYKRPEMKLSSSNFVRLKLGFLTSGGEDIRKNLDLLETNSKVNHKAFGKFDFSAIMLFKTQVAIGKYYTKINNKDTSLIVSKFLNPATLTLGFGLDYKPDKETSFNLSPFSYKGTFIPAAGKIAADSIIPGKLDQTRYGIPIGRKSLNEPGASFMISKISHPFRDLTVTNRVQLFTNYIHNPLNIDIDWEMIAVYNLNWFTDLRLNTHLIYDDDTKTPVMNGKETVKKEDGTVYKTARAQFKEMFGVSLMFKF